MKRLDLLEGAAMEATRFKPVVPLIFLEPIVDVVLGGLEVPAQTPLFFVLRPAMLDAAHFGDPDRFLPERWLSGHAAVQPHDGRAFAQFGAGPRMCPGRYLAAVEMRLVLSMLARNFTVELLCDPVEIREVMAFTMLPQRMPVRLREKSELAPETESTEVPPSEPAHESDERNFRSPKPAARDGLIAAETRRRVAERE